MTFSFQNVVIFVSDSLRWDSLPDEIASEGIVLKTVAQGSKTAISLPTLVTGTRPRQHGVYSWKHQIPENISNILNPNSVDTGFNNRGGELTSESDRSLGAVSNLVGVDTRTPLSELDSPFVYVEHEVSPHTPHAGFTNHGEYMQTRGVDIDVLRDDYGSSVEESIQRFEQIIERVKERRLAEETLFILTSDHGEVLGEHGEIGHGAPLVPEVVYVPTLLINPSLTRQDVSVDINNDIIEHVDIAPTALSTLVEWPAQTPGTDLFQTERESSFGYCCASQKEFGVRMYSSKSVWWRDGGYVFSEGSRILQVLYILMHILKSTRREYLRRNVSDLLQTYWPTDIKYGTPPKNSSEARNMLNNLLDSISKRDSIRAKLDGSDKEALQHLGYLE